MSLPQDVEKKSRVASELKETQMDEMSDVSPGVPVPQDEEQDPKPQKDLALLGKRKIDTSPSAEDTPPLKQAKGKKKEPAKRMEPVFGSVQMISLSRFEIKVPYHEPLINFFKKFATRGYDQEKRLWTFNITEYQKLMADLKAELPYVRITQLPAFVLQTFLDYAAEDHDSEIDLSRIDKKLIDTLMPFQKEGICFAIRKEGRCMIADDMGLGKTIQALGVAHYYQDDWPLLIVTPSSVRFQWSEAIFEHLPSVMVHQVRHIAAKKDKIGKEKITIVSYDILSRSVDMFEEHGFGMIICDESHGLKNYKTARTKAITRVAAKATRVLLLSGTPALSRPIELYSQITLVHRSFMGIYEYGKRYCDSIKSRFGWDYSGSCNTGELQLLLKASCLIRRVKTEVLQQLPSKIRQVVILDPSTIAKSTKRMREMEAEYEKCRASGGNTHGAIVQLYNESSGQRVAAVTNYIKDILENDQKFLVFAHHHNVLDSISELLESKKVKYIRIDGKTPPETRKTQVDLFQNSDKYRVAVLSLTAANTGITLTAANFVVFAELFWNPGVLAQAEDRVHRIGQDSGVVIRYLVAKKTADDYLWPLIQKKLEFLSKAGLNQEFSLNNADVINQSEETSDQTTLDTFLDPSSEAAAAENSADDDKKLPDDDKKLLDDDNDDYFANVDLDNDKSP